MMGPKVKKRDNRDRHPAFAVGDKVRVRSREEISQTLDSSKRSDGCLFMEQMWIYCGKEQQIAKVVRNFFDEYRFKMYKVGPWIYLLEGVICDGLEQAGNQKCDRSCFLMWHEKWLEKVERP
jgi:hypothetical protein